LRILALYFPGGVEMNMDVDLLIIGSGPAGCSTALHLARLAPSLARRTVVLEKSEHPRHKLCGGGLVSDVDTLLANLGLDLREVPHVDAAWAHLHFQGRGLRLKLSDLAFHVVRRREFDSWLAARVRDSGVALHERTQVTRLQHIDGGVLVETNRGDFRARAVVGADGTKGMTRRAIAGDAGATARVVEVMIPPPSGPSPDPLPPSDEAVFEFRHVPAGVQGYFWSFPMQIEGRAMRNLGVYDSRTLEDAPLAGSLKGYLEQELTRQGVRLSDCKVEGHPIHLYSPRSSLSVPHILLAGDAAGVDPLLGEGISLALGYGELAARTIIDGFERGDLGFADYTARVQRSALGRSLRTRHRAARLIYSMTHPALQRMVWWYLRPLVRRFIRDYMFNWARPTALPAPPLRTDLSAGAAA
jgi:menaquinone-9 beta-reductase